MQENVSAEMNELKEGVKKIFPSEKLRVQGSTIKVNTEHIVGSQISGLAFIRGGINASVNVKRSGTGMVVIIDLID